MDVLRTWKRDGSYNVMTLDAAIGNLFHNGMYMNEQSVRVSQTKIRAKIMAGDEVATRHAVFNLLTWDQ